MGMRKIHLSVLFWSFISVIACFGASREAAVNNQKGVEAMREGKYQYAIDCFRKALDDAPQETVIKNNISNAYNNYGVALMRNGDLSGALDNLERAVRYNPKNAYALMDLGQAEYKSSRLDKAVGHLSQAYELKPDIEGLSAFLKKARQEGSLESGLQKIDLMHFTIVSGESLGADNLAEVKIALDGAYSRVGALFDYFPEEKVTVIVYPENDYARISEGRPSWAHAVFDGKIRLPAAKSKYSKDFLRMTLYHEYSHALVRMLAKGNCPLWLNEGIACYAESLVAKRDRSFFGDFITRKTFVGLEGFPKSYSAIRSTWEANLFYREFYLAANFIVEKYGSGALNKILRSLGQGKSVSDSLVFAAGVDIREFARSWETYVFTKLAI